MRTDIIELYYLIDEFCKLYEMHQSRHLLPSGKQRNRQGQMNLSEMVTIMVYFDFVALWVI